MAQQKKIVLQISGSIAAFKAATLASSLVKADFNVQCICTEAALAFIGESTLEGITRNVVKVKMFEKGEALSHIDLVDWADLFLLYPSSANRIAKLCAGLADDLIGCLFLANNFQKPYWIAPAMNSHMFEHPAIKKGLATLQEWGCYVFPTIEGRMACGTVGYGRLIEPDNVLQRIHEFFS